MGGYDYVGGGQDPSHSPSLQWGIASPPFFISVEGSCDQWREDGKRNDQFSIPERTHPDVIWIFLS
jgi:hypothetical protein